MKISKVSIVTGIFGLVIAASSYLRWMVIWEDPSQAILGCMIGGVVMAGSYLYNWMKDVDSRFEHQSKRIDAFLKWWTKQEFE